MPLSTPTYIGYQSSITSTTALGTTAYTNLITQSLGAGVWLVEGNVYAQFTTPFIHISLTLMSTSQDNSRSQSVYLNNYAVFWMSRVSTVFVLSSTRNVYLIGSKGSSGTQAANNNSMRWTRIA